MPKFVKILKPLTIKFSVYAGLKPQPSYSWLGLKIWNYNLWMKSKSRPQIGVIPICNFEVDPEKLFGGPMILQKIKPFLCGKTSYEFSEPTRTHTN